MPEAANEIGRIGYDTITRHGPGSKRRFQGLSQFPHPAALIAFYQIPWTNEITIIHDQKVKNVE